MDLFGNFVPRPGFLNFSLGSIVVTKLLSVDLALGGLHFCWSKIASCYAEIELPWIPEIIRRFCCKLLTALLVEISQIIRVIKTKSFLDFFDLLALFHQIGNPEACVNETLLMFSEINWHVSFERAQRFVFCRNFDLPILLWGECRCTISKNN